MAIYQLPRPVRAGKSDFASLFERAVAAHERGQLADAERLYAKALKKDSRHFVTVCRLGILRLQQSRFEEAAYLFRRAIRLDDTSADAHHYLAFVLTGLDEGEEAVRHYERALVLRPDFAEAHNNFGHLLQRRGRSEDAILQLEKALDLKPSYAEAHNNLGNVLHLLNLALEAVAHYRKAIAIKPDYAEAYWNMANSLRALGNLDEAVASYERAIALRPDYPEAYNGLANTLRLLERSDEAVAQYKKALALKPDYADAHINLAELLGALERPEEALEHFNQALALSRDNADALIKRGAMLHQSQRNREAFESYEKAYNIDPDNQHALDGMTRCASAICDWSRSEPLALKLEAHVMQGGFADPFTLLCCSNNTAAQLKCAQKYAEQAVLSAPPLWNGDVWRNSKIRVAYLSCGFHQHPTAYLTAELLELHDRSKFEILGFSVGPDDGSRIRKRIIKAFDKFYDVRPRTDQEIASIIHEMKVDILIDRSGYTANARPGIVAQRPAPIQINYIGFPGSLGASCYDYILADRSVLPFDQQPFYSENIVHLPDCYLVSDSTKMELPSAPTRSQERLPAQGFVFCCFNSHFKISSRIFDIWMQLLRLVDGSVLWLLSDGSESQENLCQRAIARGVDPARLVFAPRVKLEEHMARHQLADLALDTLPYNSHTTARDALLSGVLLVTCPGETFTARVAASILQSAGLPELITEDLERYEALALRLAKEPQLLQRIRDKLQSNRLECAFFNGDRYRRNIESAFSTMWQLWQDGERPHGFAVSP
jgi:protein O-GlcNAc transferase